MAVVAGILVLENRSIIGRWLSELAESYHVITLCMIALVAVSLAFWNEERKITTASADTIPS